jgi:hypothetical protein
MKILLTLIITASAVFADPAYFDSDSDIQKAEEQAQAYAKKWLPRHQDITSAIYWAHKHPDQVRPDWWEDEDIKMMQLGLGEALRERFWGKSAFEFSRFFAKCVHDYSED